MKRMLLMVFLICMFPMMGRGTEPPDELKPLVNKIRNLQQDELERLASWLKELEDELKTVPRDRRASLVERIGAVKEKISVVKEQIDGLKKGTLPDWSLDSLNLSVGQVGKLDARQLEVIGIVGKDKIVLVPSKTVTRFHSGSGFSISQSFHTEHGNPFMLYGWPMQGIVDGQKIELTGLVEVFGTEQHGGRTLLALRWHDTDAVKDYLVECAARTLPKEPEQVSRVVRTWTDATGTFTVEATFRGVIAGQVRLERADKHVIAIPMEQLSNEDQEWIVGKRN
jgi:hypothetical protein